MDVRDLIKQLQHLGKSPEERNPAIFPLLRNVEKSGELERIGHALAKVSTDAISGADVKFKPLRVAVLSNFTADNIVPILRTLLVSQGIAPEFYVAGFNQLAFELSNPASGLVGFEPNVTICLLDDQVLLPEDWNPADMSYLREYGMAQVESIADMLQNFTERQPGSVILNTVPLSLTEWSSVISVKNKAVLGRIWREWNSRLLEISEQLPSAYVVDLELLLTDHPGRWQDARLYMFAGIAWHLDVFALMAREVTRVCKALVGGSKKCLVLDLDNTLWGGVIGDDGPTGIQLGKMYPGKCYTELQRMAKRLQQQGVILTVCSKNEESIVLDTFKNHPDMVLREEDFAMIVANWHPKNENIRNTATQLNIGQDSMVFVDDSSFECELVSSTLPDVTVVHLGSEPSQYLEQVLRAGYFDSLVTTKTDRERTEMYRTQVKRNTFSQSFDSLEEYLRQLEIQVDVFTADPYSLPRLTQLNLRTNQFNMTTIRYTEAEMQAMSESSDAWILGFESGDRFGKEGIVGGMWIKKYDTHWKIENYIMSCRVFSRKIEYAVLQHVIDQAKAAGVLRIEAEYRPTAKNKVVADFYPNAGFEVIVQEEGRTCYELSLESQASLMPDWINLKIKEGDVTHV